MSELADLGDDRLARQVGREQLHVGHDFGLDAAEVDQNRRPPLVIVSRADDELGTAFPHRFDECAVEFKTGGIAGDTGVEPGPCGRKRIGTHNVEYDAAGIAIER